MFVNLSVALRLGVTLFSSFQEKLKDGKLTVKEVIEIVEESAEALGLADEVIFKFDIGKESKDG